MLSRIAALSLIILSIISCGGNSTVTTHEEIIDITTTSITRDYPIDSLTEVTLTNLTPGHLYAIYPSGSILPSKGSSDLINTQGGTFLLTPDTAEFSFSGGDIGISDGTFRVYELHPEGRDMIIDESSDTPLFISSDGTKVYEEYYEIDLSEVQDIDASNVSLFSIRNGNGVATVSRGIISQDGRLISGENLMDLSGQKVVRIFNQIHIKESDGDMSQELRLMTPETISTGSKLQSPGMYRIGKTAEDIVMEIDCSAGVTMYQLMSRFPNVRDAHTGLKVDRFFPIYASDSERKLIVYIGPVSNDILFEFYLYEGSNGGTATIRPITAEEKELIQTIGATGGTISAPAGEGVRIVPFIIDGKASSSASISTTANDDTQIIIRSFSDDMRGYSQLSLTNNNPSRPFPTDHPFTPTLGYAIIRGPEAESITLTLR